MYTVREERRLPGLDAPEVREYTGTTVSEALDKALEEFRPDHRPTERLRTIMVHDLDLVNLTFWRHSLYRLTD